jgi:excisionase family DNA binding protein
MNLNESEREMTMAIERRWLKTSEVGEYLGLHPKSVYRACRNRLIPFSKAPGIGVRIDKLELDAMLERLGISPEEFGKSLKCEK